MQGLDWNDLRYALALFRTGASTRAATLLGVDDATVARRLTRLETQLGARLFDRGPDGRKRPTATGAIVLAHAERVESELSQLGEALGGSQDGKAQSVSGIVRVTAAPILVNRLIAPALPSLLAEHPDLSVELIPEARDLSLSQRDADLALRLARPQTGGAQVIARRIGGLDYAAFAAASLSSEAAAALPWAGYDAAHAHLPPARWISARHGATSLRLAAPDAETLLESAAAGVAKTLLPIAIAARDPRLQQLSHAGEGPLSREIWLLFHKPLKGLGRIEATMRWLTRLAPHAATS